MPYGDSKKEMLIRQMPKLKKKRPHGGLNTETIAKEGPKYAKAHG